MRARRARVQRARAQGGVRRIRKRRSRRSSVAWQRLIPCERYFRRVPAQYFSVSRRRASLSCSRIYVCLSVLLVRDPFCDENRTTYLDHDLIFARGWEYGSTHLGAPLHAWWPNLRLKKYATEANVKKIRFHDLRHTCARLLFCEWRISEVHQRAPGAPEHGADDRTCTPIPMFRCGSAASKIAALLH